MAEYQLAEDERFIAFRSLIESGIAPATIATGLESGINCYQIDDFGRINVIAKEDYQLAVNHLAIVMKMLDDDLPWSDPGDIRDLKGHCGWPSSMVDYDGKFLKNTQSEELNSPNLIQEPSNQNAVWCILAELIAELYKKNNLNFHPNEITHHSTSLSAAIKLIKPGRYLTHVSDETIKKHVKKAVELAESKLS